MAKDDGQERTEQPTSKRLEEARKKGQIPRSRELNTLVMMLAGAVALLILGQRLVVGLSEIMANSLQIERLNTFQTEAIPETFISAIFAAINTLVPFLVIMLIAAVIGPTMLGGVSISFQATIPKLSKLDPIKGLARIFSLKGLIELFKALIKFVFISSVGAMLFWYQRDAFLGLANEPLSQGIAHAGSLLAWAFLFLAVTLILIAAVDTPFQIWDHNRQLKMTRQEIKDEMKETEGRPEVKGKIRQLQREMAQRRMMEAVPEADVVVTNPTHYAVALHYDPASMNAPKVIAKGGDLMAIQIRNIARQANVPLLSAPPLARALYFSTDLDQEIPSSLYRAVAQVLAYVFQLRTAHEQGTEAPFPPEDLVVPREFDQEERKD